MLTLFKNRFSFSLNYHWLILFAALFISLFLNNSFNTTFDEASMQAGFNYLVEGRIGKIVHTLILALALEILCMRFSVKYVLGLILLLASVCGYYMDSLGIVINEDIIQSVLETHYYEAKDMLNLGLIGYIVGFGILPCLALSLVKLKKYSFLNACKQKVVIIITLSAFLGLSFVVGVGNDIVFVYKSHKNLVSMPNPIAPIRSSILYIQNSQERRHLTPFLIAQDAHLSQDTPPQIVLFVIGESARSANFSLNGYTQPTNPYTSTLNVISFRDFYSCGVITAISVPCMLTHYTHKTYTNRHLSLYVNNILDIAQSVGYKVWYLGNNGGKCVGGCDRSIKHTILYPSDSLDEVMLPDIERIIQDAQKHKQNTFIIAHQYGSHGASYASRYPSNFERFTPVCEQKELSKCTYEEIVNAYDNALLYNDWLLAQMIHLLQKVDLRSMLWYVSDHGESLGELGQYMHGGLGYTLAPKYQKHIPSIMWFSHQWGDMPALALTQQDKTLNHDYVFHTLLHLLGIQTQDYDKNLDILSGE